MPFQTDLVARQLSELEWALTEPLEYQGNRDLFTVPTGSETDFASVPKVLQWLIPQSGRYTKAAVLHDHLWRATSVCRQDADGIFRRAMAESGVPFVRRWLMWAAVRLVSLWQTRFRDGASDLLKILLIVIMPGTVVLTGGFIVVLLLIGFWVAECLAMVVLWPLRRFGMTARIKPIARPGLRW